MYGVKFVGLLIYNNLLPRQILISVTVFEIQGFEKSQKNPPLILGKYCPDCSVQGRLSIPN